MTHDPEAMNKFIESYPRLDLLGDFGQSFIITILSHRQGFKNLTENLKWTEKALDHWKEKENRIYVDRIESCLRDALNYVGKEDEKNGFRFPDLLNNPDNSFITLGRFREYCE